MIESIIPYNNDRTPIDRGDRESTNPGESDGVTCAMLSENEFQTSHQTPPNNCSSLSSTPGVQNTTSMTNGSIGRDHWNRESSDHNESHNVTDTPQDGRSSLSNTHEARNNISKTDESVGCRNVHRNKFERKWSSLGLGTRTSDDDSEDSADKPPSQDRPARSQYRRKWSSMGLGAQDPRIESTFPPRVLKGDKKHNKKDFLDMTFRKDWIAWSKNMDNKIQRRFVTGSGPSLPIIFDESVPLNGMLQS